MTALIQINEGSSDAIRIFSTKSTVLNATVNAGTISTTITLGVAGVYEINFWHAASAATFPWQIAITDVGNTIAWMPFLISPYSTITRRFRTSEDYLKIRFSNGGSLGLIAGYINRVD